MTQPNHASAAERRKAGVYAFLAAAFYAVSTPVAKTLLQSVGAIVLAGLLYLGAGLGMLLLRAVRRGAGIKAARSCWEGASASTSWPWWCWT